MLHHIKSFGEVYLENNDLFARLITPSSWGSQRTRVERKDIKSTTRIKQISGAVAGEIKTRYKGSLHIPISLLFFCLALFYLLLCLLH
jgi:hypothetical protein